MPEWRADWGNDPKRDMALVIEVQEGIDGDYVGRIERRLEDGELVFYVYPTTDGFRVPVKWLSAFLVSVTGDFPPNSGVDPESR